MTYIPYIGGHFGTCSRRTRVSDLLSLAGTLILFGGKKGLLTNITALHWERHGVVGCLNSLLSGGKFLRIGFRHALDEGPQKYSLRHDRRVCTGFGLAFFLFPISV